MRIVQSILAHAVTQGLAGRTAAYAMLTVSPISALYRNGAVNVRSLVSLNELTHLVSTRPTVVRIGEQIGTQSVDWMDVACIAETGAILAGSSSRTLDSTCTAIVVIRLEVRTFAINRSHWAAFAKTGSSFTERSGWTLDATRTAVMVVRV